MDKELALGILGNIIAFLLFLAPIPTFKRIWSTKSTEGFDSLPYVTALFSSTLWLYYGLKKGDSSSKFIIIINSIGCAIETIYIFIYMIYASGGVRKRTLRNLGLSLVLYFAIAFLTRPNYLGGICAFFSICVSLAPLLIIGEVIRTKSVEFMPFTLSVAITVSAVVWLLYGLVINDKFVMVPNIAGLCLGILQMIVYVRYKYFEPPQTQLVETAPQPPPANGDKEQTQNLTTETEEENPTNPQRQNPEADTKEENVVGPQVRNPTPEIEEEDDIGRQDN